MRPILSIAPLSADQAEGNSGATAFTFRVTRSGSSAGLSTAVWAVTGTGSHGADKEDFLSRTYPSGTVSFAAGQTTRTLTVAIAGDRAFEANETFRVSLSQPSAGTNLSASATSANATIRNDDPLAVLQVAVVAGSQREGTVGPTPYRFIVSRTANTTGTSAVQWAVSGAVDSSNPTNAADFTGGAFPSGTVSFAAGETSKTLTVQVNGDAAVEADEGFRLTLFDPIGARLKAGAATAIATIANDDTLLAIAPLLAARAEGNATAFIPFTFTVRRTGLTTRSSTARWQVNGSGTNPANAADFQGLTLPSGTVSFAPGETLRTITVNVIGDSAHEANETFSISLANPSSGTLLSPTASSATGSINNDDPLPVLRESAMAGSLSEGNGGTTPHAFVFSRTGDTTISSSVRWDIAGTGTNPTTGADFAGATFGTLTFAPGEGSKTLTVSVNGDTDVEANETFQLTLSAPSGATLNATASSATGTLNNDDTTLTLYNPSQGTLPSQQGWLTFGGLFGTQTRSTNGTTLSSSTNGAAGYSNRTATPSATLVNNAFPSLDRSVGFSLDFRLQVLSETHQAANRAGFSVIVLDQGATPRGIELGFWNNSIFSQTGGSTPFQTIGERVSNLSTTSATTYSLRILDQAYYLLAGNRLLLSGAVQDYSAWPKDPVLPFNPYTTSNFLFLGDNTRSASASVELGSIALGFARTGSGGADTLTGTAGADSLNGLAGADRVSGDAGDDWLAGGAGSDTIHGGSGDDVLIGGGQSDRFVFSSGAIFNTDQLGMDSLMDFNPSEDRLRLARGTFAALPSGSTLAPSAFAVVSSNAAAATSSAAIVYNSANGALFYNPNGSAAGFAATNPAGGQFAQLWGGATGAPFPTLSNTVFEVS